MISIDPIYIFYCLVIILAIVCVVSLYWWWKDAQITTLAMTIARSQLREIHIDLSSSPAQILKGLEQFSAGYNQLSPNPDEHTIFQVILACLWLLRFELGLTRNFFGIIAGMRGFESGSHLVDKSTQYEHLRQFVLRHQNVLGSVKAKSKVEQAAERLSENWAEAEEIQPRKAAA